MPETYPLNFMSPVCTESRNHISHRTTFNFTTHFSIATLHLNPLTGYVRTFLPTRPATVVSTAHHSVDYLTAPGGDHPVILIACASMTFHVQICGGVLSADHWGVTMALTGYALTMAVASESWYKRSSHMTYEHKTCNHAYSM